MSLAVIIKCSDCNSSHNTSWRSVQQHAGSMNWCRRLCTAARNSQGNCMSHVKTPLYNVEWAACDIFSFLGTWTHVCYLCEFANFLWFISVWHRCTTEKCLTVLVVNYLMFLRLAHHHSMSGQQLKTNRLVSMRPYNWNPGRFCGLSCQ